MSASQRINGISFHVPDLDAELPVLLTELENLQFRVLNHEEGPTLQSHFQLVAARAIRLFRREEEAMDLCREKGATMHRAAHQKFLRVLKGIQDRFQDAGPSVALSQDIRRDLVDWLVDHHRLMNAAMGRAIKDLVERSIQHHQSSHPPVSSGPN